LYDRILTANYKFGEEFDKLTPESADFIKKCLTVDPKLRVTAKQALAHKWFSEAAPEASISRDSILQILEERRSVKAFKPGQLIVSAAQDPVEEGDIDPPPVETPESEAPKGEAPPESEQPPKEEEPAKGEEDE
jgi:serine/threonine protein kinase